MPASVPNPTTHDYHGNEPVELVSKTIDPMALTWSIGIGIGYAFLIFLTIWIGYRCFLVYSAYQAGDFSSIVTEVKTDLLIICGYFGIAFVLRKTGHL